MALGRFARRFKKKTTRFKELYKCDINKSVDCGSSKTSSAHTAEYKMHMAKFQTPNVSITNHRAILIILFLFKQQYVNLYKNRGN